MPASGILVDAVNACKTALTGLGLVPITDPRNARPLSVLIELPTVTAFTYNVGDIELRLRVLAPPPGNQDAGDYENFDENYHGTVADDDAITYTIASNQVNAIRFLSATRTLIDQHHHK